MDDRSSTFFYNFSHRTTNNKVNEEIIHSPVNSGHISVFMQQEK